MCRIPFLRFCLEESRSIILFALPIYLSTLFSEVNNNFIPSIFSGHFGNVTTNYAAIALCTNFTFFTGTVPHMCMSSALNTLASQAYGEGRSKYIGTLYQRSILIHLLMCLPIAVIWLNTANIMTILGQPADLSIISGEYATVYICILPAYAILYPTVKILQTQAIVLPSTIIFVLGSAFEATTCYLLIFHTNMGVRGLSCGVVISVYFIAFAHLIYLRTMSVWGRIWDGFTRDAFTKWGQYIYYGITILSTLWIELIVFYFGTYLLGATSMLDPAFEISVYSIVIFIDLFLYLLSFSFQSAISFRVGILVGEGNIVKMRKVALLGTVLIFLSQCFQIALLLAGRTTWGYIFTSDERVAQAIVPMVYILAAYYPMEGIVVTFIGILVGIGEQKLGLIISILFLVCTIPIGTVLTLATKLGALSYCIGICIGIFIRFASLLPIAFCCVDWRNIVTVDTQPDTDASLVGLSEPLTNVPKTTRLKSICLHKFKVLFSFFFLAVLITIISCNFSDSKVDINIHNSYLKSSIEFCCIRFSTSHNHTIS